MFPVTSVYVLVFAFLFVLLSLNIINLRQKHSVALGDGGNGELTRAIAAHANFAQYVPLMLLILVLCEMSGMNTWLSYMLGFLMLFSRGSHAYGVMVYEINAEEGKDPLRFRKSGMIGTFGSIIIGAIFLLLLNHTSIV